MVTESTTNKHVALLIATVSSFVTPFLASSVNVALPSIGKDFAMNTVLLSWVPISYLLAAAVLLVPLGKLADIHGRKRVFVLGIALYTAAALVAAFSVSASMLIACHVVLGSAGAMIFATGTAILMSVYPPKERGVALGVSVMAVYIGLSVGPFAGGFLTACLGWRSIYVAIVPLGILNAGLVIWKLKGEWAEARGEGFDWVGSLILGLALVSLMYGLAQLRAMVAVGACCIPLGVAGLVAFIRWELRAKHPIANVRLFRHNAVFAWSNLAALINYSATAGSGFLLSLYLQYIQALTPERAGLVLGAQPVVMALVSPFAGKFSDRAEPRIVASVGMGFTVAGLAMLVFLRDATPIGYIVAALAMLGLGFGLFSSPNTNAVMSSVERRYYGVASATLGIMRLAGQMLSMGIAALILTLHVGKVQMTPQHHEGFLSAMHVTFFLFAILCLIGVFASLARGKVRE
jgi:EmrB/QacA subfamily drug resistance transporter